jgi:hypothetical protein
MSLFSAPSSISLGITFSNKSIVAVRLDQEKGLVLKKELIPDNSVVQGNILNEQGVLSALTAIVNSEDIQSSKNEESPQKEQDVLPNFQPNLWKRFFRRRVNKKTSLETGAAICLPPEAVFTAVFAIPTVVGKDMGVALIDRVTKTIPILPEDLIFLWKEIGKSTDDQYVAVAAMSKTLLDRYRTLCEKQQLRLECVTIPSSSIWLAAASHQKDTSVLIARLKGVSASSSLLYSSWPVDELVVPEGSSLEEQIEQTKEMMEQQYVLHGIEVQRVVFIGNSEEFTFLQEKGGFDLPVEETSFAVPARLVGYELGLFPILSARKDTLLNMLNGVEVEV